MVVRLQLTDVGEYWDGRYNGTELPTGDYWYVVNPNSPILDKQYVGHFHTLQVMMP